MSEKWWAWWKANLKNQSKLSERYCLKQKTEIIISQYNAQILISEHNLYGFYLFILKLLTI